MDRGRNVNLEALAEEDDEEEMEEEEHGRYQKDASDSEESSSSSDDEPDPGIKRGEPNKFDILCDGVANAMALVHTAMEELLEMKDEMLKHSLPPTLLIKLATNTGKVFRSISDLGNPVNELVRLVRVYSTPWEEKSAALKKLHEDYEAKQRQLNIAIKRLQLVDAHSKRIAREKRVMNWEKLFAKMMSNKGHGRRWKFLIDTIKQKAKLGLEHVQEYTKALEESSDEEEEDELPTIQLKNRDGSATGSSDKQSMSEEDLAVEDEMEEKEGKDDEDGSEVGSKAVPTIAIEEAEDSGDEEEVFDDNQVGSAKRVRFAASDDVAKPVKPPMKDESLWTGERDYDSFLFIRMYCPQQMEYQDLKCSLTFGKNFYKTKRLDTLPETVQPAEEKMQGKSLIGSKGGGKQVTDKPVQQSTMDLIKNGRCEEAMFSLPDEVPEGVLSVRDKPKEDLSKFQISVHQGPMDEIVAMATIELSDLDELGLRTVYLPEPHGDDDVPKSPRPEKESDLDSLSDDIDILLPGDSDSKEKPPTEDLVKDVDPLPFPLYSLSGGSSAVHKSIGTLPLLIYYGKRLRPTTYNRQCGTYGVTDLVYEATGIDLNATSKAELHALLHKEMTDQELSPMTPDIKNRASSAIRLTPSPPPKKTPSPETKTPTPEPKTATPSPTPEPKEETVPKSQYDDLVTKHHKDMELLQKEYEKRLQSIQDNLRAMEQAQMIQQQQLLQQQQVIKQQQLQQQQWGTRPRSSDRRGPSPSPRDRPHTSPEPSMMAPVPPPMPSQKPKKKAVRMAKPATKWNGGIPEDFLDRLAWFEEESYRHREELQDKRMKAVQENIEKKLAGEHKLSKKDEEMYDALKDVSLPALFMPFKTGTVYNPRAHQYFHATGSSDVRLSQPPSVFQLPPLPRNRSSVVNLFELSKNFHSRGPGWLMERYIQQQLPLDNVHGMVPNTPAPTTHFPSQTPTYTPRPTHTELDEPEPYPEAEVEC